MSILLVLQTPPYAILATLFAATIAALASVTSAIISFKTKDREFRNDYYKKIIDKRLSAYQKVEGIIFSISQVTDFKLLHHEKAIGTGRICNIFNTNKDFSDFLAAMKDSLSHNIWLSHLLIKELGDLHDALISAAEEVDNVGAEGFSEMQLARMGVKYFPVVDEARLELEILIRHEIVEIQNVKKFFSGLIPPKAGN